MNTEKLDDLVRHVGNQMDAHELISGTEIELDDVAIVFSTKSVGANGEQNCGVSFACTDRRQWVFEGLCREAIKSKDRFASRAEEVQEGWDELGDSDA